MLPGGAFGRYLFKLRQRIETLGKLSDGRAATFIQQPLLAERALSPGATACGRSAYPSMTAP